MRLDTPRTFQDIAKMTGWSYWKTKRRLMREHEKSGGKLLSSNDVEGNGARWTVTLAALRRVCPDMFDRDFGQEINDLKESVAELKTRQNMTAAAVGRVTAELARVSGR